MRGLISLLLLIGSVESAIAQEQECFENQYVVSVSRIDLLRSKTIAEIDAASASTMAVTEQAARVMLVEPKSRKRGKNPRIVRAQQRGGFCATLAKRWRMLRSRGQRVRQRSCSCNGVLRASQAVNDPFYGLQWGLHQPNDIDIDAPEAWAMSQGSRSIVVGVIDSGVDYLHPDLQANMWVNQGEIPGNGIDDDGNGYIDDYYGFNAITFTSANRLAGNPMDDNGHGTHVAGSIGAVSNNSRGVTGVTPLVRMIPIKFLSASGSGSLMDAIEAVDYATNLKRRGVNLILTNNSWGGGGYYQPLLEAIRAARDEGLLFVAAAGNDSSNNDTTVRYPSGYQVENIISVAAVTNAGLLATFSNYGATTVHVGAPGETIASTYPSNKYVYLSGTSMASPHVAGAIALLKAYSYGLSWQQLRALTLSTGDSLPALNGKTVTGKMINVHRMLQGAPASPAPPEGQPLPSPTPTITPTPSPTATPQPTPTTAPGNWNISGQVAHAGAALSGARVELQSGGVTSTRMTDVNGSFAFNGVPGPAGYSLATTKSGYAFSPVSGYLTSNKSHAISAQASAYTLTVQVYNPERIPRGGVTVNAGAYGSGQTDSLGKIQFQIPANAPYAVTLSSGTYNLVHTTLNGTLYGNTSRVAIAR